MRYTLSSCEQFIRQIARMKMSGEVHDRQVDVEDAIMTLDSLIQAARVYFPSDAPTQEQT